MGEKEFPIWVFAAGPYRSGSTTQYQIAEDIVTETNNGKGIGYHTEAKLEEFDIPGNKKFIVCKVFEFLPHSFKGEPSYGKKLFDEGRIMSIVTVRDPRDIMVSMRHRAVIHGRGFDIIRVAEEELTVWLANAAKWIDLVPSHWSRFEDFTTNLLRETRSIAKFLGIELDDKQAKDIAKRYSIRAMQEKKEEFKKKKPEEREHPWLPTIPPVMFGTSGHFKTHLSIVEQEAVERHNADFMRRFGYLKGGNDEAD